MVLAKNENNWLTGVDPEWAFNYLSERSPSNKVEQLILRFNNSNPQNLKLLVEELRLDKNCANLISGLRGAIKQKRHRSIKNGYRPRTFIISDVTFERLSYLARRNSQPRNSIITSLIDSTFKDKNSIDDKIIEVTRKAHLERKLSKQQIRSLNTQLKESFAHLEAYLKRLAALEIALGGFVPNLSSESAKNEINKSTYDKLGLVRQALSIISAEHNLYSPPLTKIEEPFSYIRVGSYRTPNW